MKLVEGVARIDDLDDFLARLGAIGDESGAAVQAFDARYVAGRDHLRRAVELANRAVERDENVARDRSVEILLYAAGRRQIDQALELGVAEGEHAVVVVVDGGDEAAAVEAVGELLEVGSGPGSGLSAADVGRIQAYFDVSQAEREATGAGLESLVCERVALLDVEK